MAEMRASLEWVEVPGGHTLMTQGEPGDAMYLVLSGRLRAYVDDEDGTPRAVREMGRGQIIGEMSLITGEPRLGHGRRHPRFGAGASREGAVRPPAASEPAAVEGPDAADHRAPARGRSLRTAWRVR